MPSPYPALPGHPSRSLLSQIIPALLVFAVSGLAAAQGYPQQQPYPAPNSQGGYQNPYDPQTAQQTEQQTEQDPPSRVARLSLLQGNISVQPASVQEFSPAELNYPLTTGDRVWADVGSLGELQFGQAAVRLGQQTDFTVTGLTDTLAQFGLAQGSVHLRTFSLDPNTTTELDTPNGAVTVLAPGDVRVDVYPSTDITVVTLLSGAAEVDAQGVSQQLRPGESLRLAGANPVYAQDVRAARPDGLDSFSAGQDSAYEAALASESSYINDATIGAADLGNYGDWSADPDYGAVWYPRGVAVTWEPYRYGHWAWIAPWGWTWIESEPWGFAPFHYGRWGQFRGRWGWVPGPAPIRPIYSPALVVFVGGGGFGGGAGVTAWFPLGPREPFQPWYHASDRYVTRVNVTNIYNRNTVEVRNIYAGRGPSPFRPDPNRQYVNRQLATVAVPQAAFAAGRPVQGSALRVAPGQFNEAPVLPHPLVSPTHAMVAPAPARALPPQIARPELQTRAASPPTQRQPSEGFRGGAQPPFPNGRQPAPGQPVPGPSAPVSRQPPTGTTAPAPPQGTPRYNPPQQTHTPPQQVTEPSQPTQTAPVQRPPEPVSPVGRPPTQPAPTAQPAAPPQPAPGYHGPVGPQRGAMESVAPSASPGMHAPMSPVQAPTAPVQRPLMNRAEPPAPRPSFDQQREVIERSDPGRPLGPQQLNNLQQNRPAGQPAQREAVPHPAPTPPAAAPKPAPAAPPPANDHKH